MHLAVCVANLAVCVADLAVGANIKKHIVFCVLGFLAVQKCPRSGALAVLDGNGGSLPRNGGSNLDLTKKWRFETAPRKTHENLDLTR